MAAGDSGGRALVEQACRTVDYLRVSAGDDRPPGDWFSCSRLVDDAGWLAEVVASTKAGRGTSDDGVAMSLFVQGYGFRIASLAVGGWLLGDAVLEVGPANTSIRLGRHRPNGVHLQSATLAGTGTVDDLHSELVEGHLARLVATAHRACRVGERLLWANVGASCASSFGAFMEPLAHRRTEIRRRAQEFFAAARSELATSGRLVPIGPVWAWERGACCLWYKTDSGFKCDDCSLWTPAERQARYRKIRDEVSS